LLEGVQGYCKQTCALVNEVAISNKNHLADDIMLN
jgi:hypothetical protein